MTDECTDLPMVRCVAELGGGGGGGEAGPDGDSAAGGLVHQGPVPRLLHRPALRGQPPPPGQSAARLSLSGFRPWLSEPLASLCFLSVAVGEPRSLVSILFSVLCFLSCLTLCSFKPLFCLLSFVLCALCCKKHFVSKPLLRVFRQIPTFLFSADCLAFFIPESTGLKKKSFCQKKVCTSEVFLTHNNLVKNPCFCWQKIEI